jgi:hypothetical protein
LGVIRTAGGGNTLFPARFKPHTRVWVYGDLPRV